jgi:GH24 family phage-related lysozyme (muramidase)
MIKLIKSYPYDNSYDYIKMFSSKAEQTNYFNSLSKELIEENNYIKIENSFNVNFDYDYLDNEGVNYIIFNNGYRDIFAFIIKKEFVRNEVTRLIYEIDVIQTYMFNFNVKNSFVERKVCSIGEVADYDEGLNVGEHIIENVDLIFDKDSTYFAMFNGFKEQQLLFDENNVLKSVVDLPFQTSKPLTVIDGTQYPLYFMPLKEQSQYKMASFTQINVPGYGETIGGQISAKILRFIKGYEGFASFPANFNGEDFKTGGYGITDAYQLYYFNLMGNAPYTERIASEILAQMMNNEQAETIYLDLLQHGLTGADIKQHHFDAFVSLAMNAGIGGCQNSPMYSKYIANQNDTSIYNDWLSYAKTSQATGEVLQGLVDRRKAEADIFRDGVYAYRTITMYGMGGNVSGTVTDNNGNGYIPPTVNGGV